MSAQQTTGFDTPTPVVAAADKAAAGDPALAGTFSHEFDKLAKGLSNTHVFTSRNAETWSEDDVSAWLKSVGLGQYVDLFKENNVKGKTLLRLTSKKLEDEYYIQSAGKRDDIIYAIETLISSERADQVVEGAGDKKWIFNDVVAVSKWLEGAGEGVDSVSMDNSDVLLRLTSKKMDVGCIIKLDDKGAASVRSIKWTPEQVDEIRHALQERTRHSRERANTSEGWNSTCVIHEVTLRKLLVTLLDDKAEGKVLVRAPPGSGKTTMAETFANFCVEQGYVVYSLTLLGFTIKKHQDADGFFSSYDDWRLGALSVQTSLSTIIDRAKSRPDDKPLILIIDEVQIWYDDDMKTFWQTTFKKPVPGLKTLFFAAYGDARDSAGTGTPPQIGKCVRGIELLRISLNDAKEMATRMIGRSKKARDSGLQLHQAALEGLFDLANGHVQVIREVLEKFIDQPENYMTEEHQVDFLQSQKCFTKIGDARAFMRVTEMYKQLKGANVSKPEFLNMLLETNKGSRPVVVAEAEQRKIMLQYGLFYQDEEAPKKLHILCPAAFDVLLAEHLAGKMEPKDDLKTFEEFLVTTVQHMDKRLLHSSFSDVAQTGEDFYQKEFYRACTVVLSPISRDEKGEQHSYTIQTDAGISPTRDRRYKGKCDFFIDSTLRWAVELMCQGNHDDPTHKKAIVDHVMRFHSTGHYNSLNSKHKAVVDFYVADNAAKFEPKQFKPTQLDPSVNVYNEVYWAVVFSTDFSKAVVHKSSQRDGNGKWTLRKPVTVSLV